MRIKKFLLTIAAAFGLITVSAVAANADTVTVKSGDTLSKIATEYNTTVSSIQQLNHLADVNLIYVGEQLQVNGNETQSNQANNQPQAAVQQPAASNNQTKQTQNTQSAAQSSQTTQATANNNASSSSSSNLSSSDAAAKAWIVARESGGNYNARNGQYVGAYQLSASYLGGDYSPAQLTNTLQAVTVHGSMRKSTGKNAAGTKIVI